MHEADRPLADDEDSVVGREVEQLDAFEDRVQGLNEGSLLEGHAVGDRNHAAVIDDKVHDADVLRKAAA